MKCDHSSVTSIRISKVPDCSTQAICKQESINRGRNQRVLTDTRVRRTTWSLVGFLQCPQQNPGNVGPDGFSARKLVGLVQRCTCMSLPHLGRMGFQVDTEVCRLRIRRAPRSLRKWNDRSAAPGNCPTQSAPFTVLKDGG